MVLALALLMPTALAHSHPGDEELAASASPWAKEEVARWVAMGLDEYVRDQPAPITREVFTALTLQYVALQFHCDDRSLAQMVNWFLGDGREAPFTGGTDVSAAAYHLGIVEGRGDGSFDREGHITRQEAAVMLTRAYQVCGGVLPEQGMAPAFADGDAIADWAKEAVAAVAALGVMQGGEDGTFDPEGVYSMEQCRVTLLRLYEKAPVSRKNGNVTPLFSYEQCEEYMEWVFAEAKINHGGYYEVARVEGPTATFLQTEFGGWSRGGTRLYFLYREGGLREIKDVGLCNMYGGKYLSGAKLSDCRFSEDGATFFCTLTMDENVPPNSSDEETWHKNGVYHITVDVDTCAYAWEREDLPR